MEHKGYLLKNMDPDDWLQYLRSIIEGSNTVAKDLAGKLLYQFRERDLQNAPSISSLTPREKEILLLVSKGLTNKQIANQLFISENTVKNHMKNLLEKLNMRKSSTACFICFKIYYKVDRPIKEALFTQLTFTFTVLVTENRKILININFV